MLQINIVYRELSRFKNREKFRVLTETYEWKLNDADNLWRSGLPFSGYWGVKREQREDCQSFQSSVKVNNVWSFSPLYLRRDLGSSVILTFACGDDTQ
jgi:hypothetical protein